MAPSSPPALSLGPVGFAHRWTKANHGSRSLANGTRTLTATPRDATGRTITAVATDGPPRDDLDHHL